MPVITTIFLRNNKFGKKYSATTEVQGEICNRINRCRVGKYLRDKLIGGEILGTGILLELINVKELRRKNI